jgi:phage gp36-like protein
MTIAVVKQPRPTLKYALNFATIATGFVITNVQSLVVTARGLVTEETPLTATQETYLGTTLYIKLAGGTDGETYLVNALVQDNNGETHEADVEVGVIDLTFRVPDAPAAVTYIAPADYVTRYGVPETIRLTDENQLGVIDKGVLFAALADAAAEMDGYLAKRYALPLAPVPPLLESIAAAITRARLHTADMPELVADTLKAARQQLRDISRGEIVLPNVVATGTSSGAPVYETSQGPFSGRKMRCF